MKVVFTVAALLCVLLNTQTAHAKIWRVNNNSGVQADFTTLNAAHAAAAAGDTLHLEGSPTSYGTAEISKKLFIVGPGYFLNENLDLQASNYTAKVGRIDFNPGAEGSVVMGLDFSGNSLRAYCSDLVIRRNLFSNQNGSTADWSNGTVELHYRNGSFSLPVTDIIISQNFGVRIVVHYASTGVLITNNFIGMGLDHGETTTTSCLSVNANAIVLVQNNIFRRGRIVANNSNFINNIMVAGTFDGTGNLVSNNLANASQFGNTNGNKENVDMSTVFVGAGTGISSDAQWKLKSGSPASGAGYGSTSAKPVDCGMFSGSTPYVLAGQAPMPAIYFFQNQPVGSNTDPIDVTIKVKSVGN